jgi:outer membrane protein assembly factor BamB
MQSASTQTQLTTETQSTQRHSLVFFYRTSFVFSVSLWLVLALPVVAGIQAQSQDWPQFLGPKRNGSIEAAMPATPKLVEAWRKPLGAGMSAIVVSHGRAFTLYTDDTDDYLVALEAATGADVWKVKLGKTHDDTVTNGPGSTPAIAGDLVIALGSSCRLQAFEMASGKPAWDLDVAAAYKSRFATRGGCSISPVVHGNLVVLPTGATDGDRLVALDAISGKPVWSAKDVERSINTNPSFWNAGSGAQLLYHYVKAPGKSGIAGVNLKDGSTAWSLDAESGMSNTAPMPLGAGRVLLQMWSGSAAFDVPAAGAPRQLWSNAELTALPVPAVYADGHLYGFGGNSGEFFKCVDAMSGTVKWSTRIYRGAAVIAGRTLVIQSESSGLLRLVAADPAAYRELTKTTVLKPGASTLTPPTIAGGMVFVRNLEEIVGLRIQ